MKPRPLLKIIYIFQMSKETKMSGSWKISLIDKNFIVIIIRDYNINLYTISFEEFKSRRVW